MFTVCLYHKSLLHNHSAYIVWSYDHMMKNCNESHSHTDSFNKDFTPSFSPPLFFLSLPHWRLSSRHLYCCEMSHLTVRTCLSFCFIRLITVNGLSILQTRWPVKVFAAILYTGKSYTLWDQGHSCSQRFYVWETANPWTLSSGWSLVQLSVSTHDP
jgi:hypothetical protein